MVKTTLQDVVPVNYSGLSESFNSVAWRRLNSCRDQTLCYAPVPSNRDVLSSVSNTWDSFPSPICQQWVALFPAIAFPVSAPVLSLLQLFIALPLTWNPASPQMTVPFLGQCLYSCLPRFSFRHKELRTGAVAAPSPPFCHGLFSKNIFLGSTRYFFASPVLRGNTVFPVAAGQEAHA